jgi:hypothetical protein
MKNNSIITKNPHEHYVFDLTKIGTMDHIENFTQITQASHYFQVGDILYYDVNTKLFSKALAINNIESEVCGIVSDVKDKDTFTIISSGEIITPRYNFDTGTPLFLSDVYPGKLVSIKPSYVVKQIAIQIDNGIKIDIHQGQRISVSVPTEELESYTQDELDEIIKNIW